MAPTAQSIGRIAAELEKISADLAPILRITVEREMKGRMERRGTQSQYYHGEQPDDVADRSDRWLLKCRQEKVQLIGALADGLQPRGVVAE